MKSMRLAYLTGMFFVMTLGWTQTAETSDPLLGAGELPASVTGCGGGEPCAAGREYAIRWVARSETANLFLVAAGPCGENADCGVWLVEKSDGRAREVLELTGRYRLIPAGDTYPDIDIKEAQSDTRLTNTRFRWEDGRYVQTESLELFRVDGVECGTRVQCDAAARAALRERPAEALRIWETVHGRSWI